jgi:3-phosphoshikimate 1-carboxyvinyltransferase
MFRAMGSPLEIGEDDAGRPFVTLPASDSRGLHAAVIEVPRDFSAAAFFLVAGSIFPDSDLLLPAVGVNKTRIGLLHLLRKMGADIAFENEREVCGEPVADLRVRTAALHGIEVSPEDVVLAIDEVPVFSLAAAVATGTTRVTGAGELRVKESDRLATTAEILRGAGVSVEELPDGLIIEGTGSAEALRQPPLDAPWRKSGDHRIAMCGAIVDLLVSGSFELQDAAAVETSFPNFVECFSRIR